MNPLDSLKDDEKGVYIPFERILNALAMGIQTRWEAEWRLADLCLEITKVYPKHAVQALAKGLGRSHQDIYRWSSLAEAWPPESRRADRSPQEHRRVSNGGRWKDEQGAHSSL